MEKILQMLLEWIKSAPKWVRAVVPLLVAAIAALYLCTSCGTIQRVQLEKRMVRETKDTTRLLISTATTKTTMRVRSTAPLSAWQIGAIVSESDRVDLPLASEASMSASPYGENSAHRSTAGSARRDIAKRSAVNSANVRAVSTINGDYPPLRCGDKDNRPFKAHCLRLRQCGFSR